LAASLIEHETISTTIQKAKEIKPFVEKLITLAKKGALKDRRQVIALLGNRNIVEYKDGEAVKKGTVVGKLFSELGQRFLERPGGYTRIIRLSLRRLGDNGQLVLFQLLGKDEPLKKKTKAPSKRRARRKKSKAAAAEAAQTQATAEAAESPAAEPGSAAAPAEKAEAAEDPKQSSAQDADAGKAD
jgi:large subunit ribosomal protein L17